MIIEFLGFAVGIGGFGFGFTHLLAYMNRVEAQFASQEEQV